MPRVKKSAIRSKKSPVKKSPVRKSKSLKRKSAARKSKSPVRKSKSLKRKSAARKSKSLKRKSAARKSKQHPGQAAPISKSEKRFVKNLIESLKFSDEDIENLFRDAPKMEDEKDEAIIRKRLQNFVYDPSYEGAFFKRDPKWSLEDAAYFQAAARLAEYGKGYLNANEI